QFVIVLDCVTQTCAISLLEIFLGFDELIGRQCADSFDGVRGVVVCECLVNVCRFAIASNTQEIERALAIGAIQITLYSPLELIAAADLAVILHDCCALGRCLVLQGFEISLFIALGSPELLGIGAQLRPLVLRNSAYSAIGFTLKDQLQMLAIVIQALSALYRILVIVLLAVAFEGFNFRRTEILN